ATLRDLARALSRSGRAADALVVYRALGPRLSLFPSPEERARTFLEGAELAFALGSSALDDAIAFLSESKQLPVRDLAWRAASELALALDRRGRSDEAQSLAVELVRSLRKESLPETAVDPAKSPMMSGEQLAAMALVLESVDPQRASQAWERYLNLLGDESPWREHARKRLESLKAPRRGLHELRPS